MKAANDDIYDLYDNLYEAASEAVKLLCLQSRWPGDEYDLAAMRLGDAADQIPARPKTTADQPKQE